MPFTLLGWCAYARLGLPEVAVGIYRPPRIAKTQPWTRSLYSGSSIPGMMPLHERASIPCRVIAADRACSLRQFSDAGLCSCFHGRNLATVYAFSPRGRWKKRMKGRDHFNRIVFVLGVPSPTISSVWPGMTKMIVYSCLPICRDPGCLRDQAWLSRFSILIS